MNTDMFLMLSSDESLREALSMASANADIVARVRSNAAGVYFVAMIGAGEAIALPSLYIAKAQAMQVAWALNAIAQSGDQVQVLFDTSARMLCAMLKNGAMAQDQLSRMMSVLANLAL